MEKPLYKDIKLKQTIRTVNKKYLFHWLILSKISGGKNKMDLDGGLILNSASFDVY